MDIPVSPTPSEMDTLSKGEQKGKENCLDHLLDTLQNYSNGERNVPYSGLTDSKDQEEINITEMSVSPDSSQTITRRLSAASSKVESPIKQNISKTEPPPCPPRNKKEPKHDGIGLQLSRRR